MKSNLLIIICLFLCFTSCSKSGTPEGELRYIVKNLQNDEGFKNLKKLRPSEEDFKKIFVNDEVAKLVSEYSKRRWAVVDDLPVDMMNPNNETDKIAIVSSNKEQLVQWRHKGLPENYTALAEFIKDDVVIYGMKYVNQEGRVIKQRAGFFNVDDKWILIPETFKAFF